MVNWLLRLHRLIMQRALGSKFDSYREVNLLDRASRSFLTKSGVHSRWFAKHRSRLIIDVAINFPYCSGIALEALAIPSAFVA